MKGKFMKKRIDVLLVEQGFFESREKAKRSIMAGLVFVDNQKCDKAGTEVKTDAKIEVKGNPIPYVSRGGLKLEKAMKVTKLCSTKYKYKRNGGYVV